MKRFFSLFRILSLDVVVGACVSSLFVAHYLHVMLPWFHIMALALCVWLIYTADHLTDAYQIKHHAHSSRHSYHQQYFRPLSIAFICVSVAGVFLLFYMPTRLIYWGLSLVAFVGIYFLLIKLLPPSKNYYKETMIAFLYASGVFLSPLSLYPGPLSADILLIFLQFVLLALANLIIFSLYEVDRDKQDGQFSFATILGTTKAGILVHICLATVLCIGISSLMVWHSHPKFLRTEGLFTTMAVTLWLIVAFPTFFRQKERYRVVGDAVFLFPALALFS